MKNRIEGNICCHYDRNVLLRDRTWIHRGGKVDYWIVPETIDQLIDVGRALYQYGEKFITIGHTSNVYFRDDFDIKYIIDTRKLRKYDYRDNTTLMCEAGLPASQLSRICIEKGYAGYEGMINLPGTVGGHF